MIQCIFAKQWLVPVCFIRPSLPMRARVHLLQTIKLVGPGWLVTLSMFIVTPCLSGDPSGDLETVGKWTEYSSRWSLATQYVVLSWVVSVFCAAPAAATDDGGRRVTSSSSSHAHVSTYNMSVMGHEEGCI